MNWTVYWEEAAMNELADRWFNADSAGRRAITRAAQQLDDQLAWDPYQTSESRDQNRRVIFESPLAALFEVDQVGHTVRVLHVWTFRT